METALPPEIFSQVLTFLDAPDVASVVSTSRKLQALGQATKCVSDATTFRKAACPEEWDTKYADHFILQRIPGSAGGVTFRNQTLQLADTRLSRKLMLQLLVLTGEYAAAMWMAKRQTGGCTMTLPRRQSCSLSLMRDVPWDFQLYSMVCHALEQSSLKTVHLHVRSMAGIMQNQEPLTASPQTFLCSLLHHAHGKTLLLHLCGKYHDLPHTALSETAMDMERRKVDAVFEQDLWGDGIQVYGHQDFRSSTLALGTVLVTAQPHVKVLDLQNYVFDEMRPSMDVALFVSWLHEGALGHLVRATLHGVSFTCGGEFCDVVRALCSVPTLESLRLACVEYWTDAPEDPVRIVFEDGVAGLKDVRMHNMMRTHAGFPFDALPVDPGYRSLGLSRMFLDTAGIHSLVTKVGTMPHLLSLDLSSNGIDGACLGLFATALQSPQCGLQRLKLNSNVITSTCVLPFCDALSRNTSLLHLDLSDNFLGTKSSISILQTVFSHNRTLVRLHLDSNQVRVSLDDLYGMLVPHPRSTFRQIFLKDNPIEIDDPPRSQRMLADTFGVSFQF